MSKSAQNRLQEAVEHFNKLIEEGAITLDADPLRREEAINAKLLIDLILIELHSTPAEWQIKK